MSIQSRIAPSGTIRFAINIGNSVLTRVDPKSGEVGGITVNLARDIARELDLPYTLEIFNSARAVVETASQDAWDFAFVARDPKRSESITFSNPYFLIEGSYLVRKDSPINSNKEVDQTGVTVAVGKGAAYDLYLSRNLKNAKIVRTVGSKPVDEMLMNNTIDVAAGIRPAMAKYVTWNPALRMLSEPFMFIEQAIGTPVQNRDGARFIETYLKEAHSSGRIEKLCKAP
ncbi:transporter substrate-binding domain-containing protein [Thalassospira povalilytica]|uniref:transporter substrate-binding domain-containing protein n=1 Tax=Thalassospira povalilytica TaxID=732237 RepID=UPI003AA817F5